MARRNNRQSRGLILLVVLGMLTLFSFLAVTYVVYAGQSRTASMAMSRRDNRGTPPDKLMDYAIKQVIRGTSDNSSALFHNSLLEDLNGLIDGGTTLSARKGIPFGDSRGPKLYSGHLLKIPLEVNANLPLLHDALTGRVITFQGGPLAGQSFRILRYIGQIPGGPFPPEVQALQFSILIDVSEVSEREVTLDVSATTTPSFSTRTIADWARLDTNGNGASLLYRFANGVMQPNLPFDILLNGAVFNSVGAGQDVVVDTTLARLNSTVAQASASSRTFYPSRAGFPQANLVAPYNSVAEAILPNHSQVMKFNSGSSFSFTGDLDEGWDAADYQNFALALTGMPSSGSTLSSDDVIPSFHRPAVINHIASLDANGDPIASVNLASITPAQFISFLELVQRASARPLSCKITNFPEPTTNQIIPIIINPQFTGSSPVEAPPVGNPSFGNRNPQLVFDWNNRASEQANFDSWLRWQVRGSWDVDNDGDGVKDSVWADLNFPLMTSPEGKLLKVLAAFYIEDMDGKLDLNATGSLAQQDSSYNLQLNDRTYGNLVANNTTNWPQSLGAGTADISLAPVFGTSGRYQQFLAQRYASPGDSGLPGRANEDDGGSRLVTRGWARQNGASSLLPFSMKSKIGIAVDVLGNARILNTNSSVDAASWNEKEDDPYDSRILRGSNSDNPYTASDYERLVRFNDWDHSSMSFDLENQVGNTLSVASIKNIRSISPRNAALTLPAMFHKYFKNNTTASLTTVSSMPELIEALVQERFMPPMPLPMPPTPPQLPPSPAIPIPYVTASAFAKLFPLEFSQNRQLDLNRPLGNGFDENADGLVDDPREFDNPQQSFYWDGTRPNGSRYAPIGLFNDYSNPAGAPLTEYDPSYNAVYQGDETRQLLARHLYCLAQLLLPADKATGNNLYIFPNQADVNTPVDNDTRARILAQWAINVVDFRDNDTYMTRFPYDPDPFHDSMGNFSPAWQPDNNHVVFGIEQPELLITESLAFHDIRMFKNPAKKPSDPPDQFRVPQGSLFLEFYSPRSITPPGVASRADAMMPEGMGAHYDQSGNHLGLNLSAVSPADTNGITYPVWRVLILDPDERNKMITGTAASTTGNLPQQRYVNPTDRSQYSYQIGAENAGIPYRYGRTGEDPVVDRMVWFANLAPTVGTPGNVPFSYLTPESVFRYQQTFEWENIEYDQANVFANNNVFLQGGQYLVVGPRPWTSLGSRTPTGGARENRPNFHRIELGVTTNSSNGGFQNWPQMYDINGKPEFWPANSYMASSQSGGLPTMGQLVANSVNLMVGALPPTGWEEFQANGAQQMIGINISEPISDRTYYAVPTERVSAGDATDAPNAPFKGFDDMPKDAYFDENGTTTGGSSSRPSEDSKYLGQKGVNTNPQPDLGTIEDWSTAVLQRLANPSRPWHEVLNPYITVDWVPIDLTIFSGEENLGNPTHQYKLGSRQKSGLAIAPSAPLNVNGTERSRTFYSYHSINPPQSSTDPNATQTPFFDHVVPMEAVVTTLMAPFNATPQPRGIYPGATPFATLGYLNHRFEMRGINGAGAVDTSVVAGQPFQGYPFFMGAPQLTPVAPYFPDRDFVSSLEVTSVPISGPGAFNQEFSAVNLPASANPAFPSFTHVLDFEQAFQPPGLPAPKRTGALLEMISTSSPWPDAWTVLRPDVTKFIIPDPMNPGPDMVQNLLLGTYRAPYNMVPTFREPGRINLNTISQDTVFKGLMWGSIAPANPGENRENATTTPNLNSFIKSIHGSALSANPPAATDPLPYGQRTGIMSGNGNPNLDAQFPTEFPGVFTSSSAGGMFPQNRLNSPNTATHTLLRRTAKDGNARVFSTQEIEAFQVTNPTVSTIANSTFFQNYPAARLANLTTTKSNVYSVRMTLGYFEFDSANGIGVEYGSEQGRSKRNRAFYLIDRSIPVGFQVGIDNNVEQTILSRRIVE